MASKNKTANLHLSQFVGTDYPSWLTDYNNDMEKIDDAVKNTQDSVASTESKANSLQESVDTLNENYVNLDREMTSVKSRTTQLEKDVETVQGTVGSLSQDVAEVEAKVAQVSEPTLDMGMLYDYNKESKVIGNAVQSFSNELTSGSTYQTTKTLKPKFTDKTKKGLMMMTFVLDGSADNRTAQITVHNNRGDLTSGGFGLDKNQTQITLPLVIDDTNDFGVDYVEVRVYSTGTSVPIYMNRLGCLNGIAY